MFNANIEMSGRGYQGIQMPINGTPDNCGINPAAQFVLPSTDNSSYTKGDGIVVNDPNTNRGRSPRANGGGSGVSGDSGGGGGSNYGGGGLGGWRWCDEMGTHDGTTPEQIAGGVGGFSLTPYLAQDKVFLGGAGGPGWVSTNNPSTAADGGGIVIIFADTIEGNGFSINNLGLSPTAVNPVGAPDGGGGGGAGGTVVLKTKTYIGNLTVNASGGQGQDLNTTDFHGPGGGGGGGVLLYSLASLPAGITLNVAPGQGGQHNNAINVPVAGVPANFRNGSTDGEPGGSISLYVPIQNPNYDFNIDADNILSTCDIDDDNDGIPDINELYWRDHDGDGTPDYADPQFCIATFGAAVCANGLPDPRGDLDGDGRPNYQDADFPYCGGLTSGQVCRNWDADGDGNINSVDVDSDNDGIPDLVEAGGVDIDGDGQIDNPSDIDGDGLLDTYDNDDTDGPTGSSPCSVAPQCLATASTSLLYDGNNNGTPDRVTDADRDGVPNMYDLDADNDGIPDIVEAGGTDINGDGYVDSYNPGTGALSGDKDGDGFQDIYDATITVCETTTTSTTFSGGAVSQTNTGITNPNNAVTATPVLATFAQAYDNADVLTLGINPAHTLGTSIQLYLSGDATINNAVTTVDFSMVVGGPFTNPNTFSVNVTAGGMTIVTIPISIPCRFVRITRNDGSNIRIHGMTYSYDANVNNTVCNTTNGNPLIVTGPDTNADGLTNSYTEGDKDRDNVPNFLDLDADNDGIPDVIEALGTDTNGDGIADNYVDTDLDGFNDIVDGDVNNDGIAENSSDALVVTGDDANSDGIPDSYPNANNDGDAIPNYLDLDADNDGIADVVEALGVDANGDGLIDNYADTDGDGYDDTVDATIITCTTSNVNNIVTISGTASTIASNVGPVDNANNALGAANATYAEFYQNADALVLDLGQTLPIGATITISWRKRTGEATARIGVGLSTVNGGFTNFVPTPQTTDNTTTGITSTLTTTILSRFIRIFDNGGGDFELDAIAWSYNTTTITTPTSCTQTSIGLPLILTGVDGNNDGKPDTYPQSIANMDGTSYPNFLDLDSDGDGIVDLREVGNPDADNNGIIDGYTDTDNDGWSQNADGDTDNNGTVDNLAGVLITTSADGNNDGRADSYPNKNADSHGFPNFIDIDADNDGIVDNTEGQSTIGYIAPAAADTDGDGIDNAYDATVGFGGRGLVPVNKDKVDNPDYLDLDTDNDGILDLIEGHDTDGDGVADAGSLANNGVGGALDIDNDGLLDGFDNNTASTIATNTGLNPNSHPDVHNTKTRERDWREANTTYASNDVNTTTINTTVVGNVLTNDHDLEGNTQTLNALTIDTDGDGRPNAPVALGTPTVVAGVNEDGSPSANAGTLTQNANGTYTFVPAPDFVGEVTYSYRVCDNGVPVACATATVTIDVEPAPGTENGELAPAPDWNVTHEDIAVSGQVLANDNDPDGDVLTVTGPIDVDTNGDGIVDGTAPLGAPFSIAGVDVEGNPFLNAGTIIQNPNGTYTFDPVPGFIGVVSYLYTVCDNGIPMLCEKTTVTIRVLPALYNSTNAIDDEEFIDQGATLSANVLTNDFDVEGNTQSGGVTLVSTTTNGTLVLNSNGTYTYTPTDPNFSGNDKFVYQVCDNGTPVECDIATVYITVLAVDRDFGDGPAAYGVASHRAIKDVNSDNILDGTADVWLGTGTSFETSTKPVDVDDFDDAIELGTGTAGNFPRTITASTLYPVDLTLNSSTASNISYGMWIDWNNDGVYEDFYSGTVGAPGGAFTTVVNVNSPAIVTTTLVNIRLRVHHQPLLFADFQGQKTNGEVEDYQFLMNDPLPVEMLYFNAKLHNRNTALLDWATATELNNMGYDVEHALPTTGTPVFNKIGFVVGYGTTTSTQYYGYEVPNLIPGVHYFRLKQVDFDGTFTYTATKALEVKGGVVKEVFPTILTEASRTVFIKVPTDGDYSIEVVTPLGQVVQSVTQKLFVTAYFELEFDLTKYASGVYFVRVTKEEESFITKIRVE